MLFPLLAQVVMLEPLLAADTHPVGTLSLDDFPLIEFKQIILWLGPAILLLFLGIFNLGQTFTSKTGQETAAKLIVNCLGFVLVFWIWNTLNIDHTEKVREFLTSPAPEGASAQFWYGAIAAVSIFAFSFLLELLGDLTKGHNLFQAITVFLSCVGIYLLSPLVLLLADPERLMSANFYHISTGLAIGGMVYLIFLLFGLAKLRTKKASKS